MLCGRFDLQLKIIMVWFALYNTADYEPQCSIVIRNISCSDADIYTYDGFIEYVSFVRYKFALLYGKTERSMHPVAYMHRRHKSVNLVACLKRIKILSHMKYLSERHDIIATNHKLGIHTLVEPIPSGFVEFIDDLLSGKITKSSWRQENSIARKLYITPYYMSRIKQLLHECSTERCSGYMDMDEIISYPPRYMKAIFKSAFDLHDHRRLISFVRGAIKGSTNMPCPHYYLAIVENYIQERVQ